MNGNKLQKSIPKGGLCLKLYSNWMCSSSGEMPKKRYKYISISLWLLLATLQKEREKMQQLSVHIKPAERCLVFRSQTPAASETHRPPRCPRNRALSPSTPSQKVCGDANPLTPVTMSSWRSSSVYWEKPPFTVKRFRSLSKFPVYFYAKNEFTSSTLSD